MLPAPRLLSSFILGTELAKESLQASGRFDDASHEARSLDSPLRCKAAIVFA